MYNTEYLYGLAGETSQPPSEGYQSADDSHTSEVVLPWWPSQPGQVFHTATQLTDGRLSMIADCGAWSNLMGADLTKALARRARQQGFMPSERRIPRLSISGVGNGHQHCDWEVRVPIAIPQANPSAGAYTSLIHNLTTPVVEGEEGARLPGLLGLQSMERMRAVIDTHSRKMILPGPGDIKYVLPPGSLEIPLEKAPSGHLVFVIDAYESERAGPSGGLVTQGREFHAHLPEPQPTDGPHPEASSHGPTTRARDEAILPVGRRNPPIDDYASIPGFGLVVRGVAGDTSSSSRDSHLPELPPEEDPDASP